MLCWFLRPSSRRGYVCNLFSSPHSSLLNATNVCVNKHGGQNDDKYVLALRVKFKYNEHGHRTLYMRTDY